MMQQDGIRSLAVAVLLALVPVAVPGAALAQDVSGDWQVRWAQAIRVNSDGTVEVQRWGDAMLRLSQEGVQVTGTWTTNVVEEVNWTVAGTFEGDRITLRATENDSTNPELDIVEQLVWEATQSRDGLEGTVAMRFRGMDREPGLRPFTATRIP